MNRIKVEGSVSKIGNRTRSAAKRTTTTRSRKSPKKRYSSTSRGNNTSDEEFECKSTTARPTNSANTILKRIQPRRSGQLSSCSSNFVKNTTRKSMIAENIYQISDSSDDDDVYAIGQNECEPINLCEAQDTIDSKDKILSEIIKNVENEMVNSKPSTSKTITISSTSSSNMPGFIDKLLCSNDDFIKENFKSLKELNEETDKLLASSLDLINNDGCKSMDDSIVYVCTEKNVPQVDNSAEGASANIDLTKASQEDKKLKAQCPICLDELGSQSISSTICGHIFCTACIKNCITSQRKCPTCRKRLTSKMIHPLFLF